MPTRTEILDAAEAEAGVRDADPHAKRQTPNAEVQEHYAAAGSFRPRAAARAGAAAADAGDPAGAAVHFRALVEHDPADAVAHKNLAAMLLEQSPRPDAALLEEATTHLRAAVQVAPRWADARFGWGVALQRSGDHAGAMRQYQLALTLDPEHASAHATFLRLTQEICDWAHLPDLWARSRHWLSGPDRALPDALTPFSVLAMPSTPAEQQEAARRWATACVTVGAGRSACGVRNDEQERRPQPAQRAKRRTPNAERPLRIGYLAADFRDDPVTRQVIGVLEGHDPARARVTGYCLGGPQADASALRPRCIGACHHWIDLSASSAQEAAQRIADDGIDVLVDLQGYTQGCRPEILARRPAPVQVSYLGYPGSMGAPFIDYVITDRYLTPPSAATHWTERFAYLPDCYMPGDPTRQVAERPTRAACGLPERGMVFCCFNHTIKITPAVFDVWMRLLRQTPRSVLWLFAYHPCAPTQLRAQAQARGVEPERLVFLEQRPHAEYLAAMQVADLFLDTWPYSAGATANDALWAGLPILTQAGPTYISRMAASQCRAAGLPDMVAGSVRQYERWALELVQSRAALAGVRMRAQDARQRAPLFDRGRYVRALEDAYRRLVIHAQAQAGV